MTTNGDSIGVTFRKPKIQVSKYQNLNREIITEKEIPLRIQQKYDEGQYTKISGYIIVQAITSLYPYTGGMQRKYSGWYTLQRDRKFQAQTKILETIKRGKFKINGINLFSIFFFCAENNFFCSFCRNLFCHFFFLISFSTKGEPKDRPEKQHQV